MALILASVIIPSYNCAPWLERSVLSALALSEDQVEVVIVDDGSTDETPKICGALEARYPQVRVIRQINAGVSAARNAGISVSRGDYVIFLDADDVLIPFDLSAVVSGEFDLIRVGVQISRLDRSVEFQRGAFSSASGVDYLKVRLEGFGLVDSGFCLASWAYFYKRQWLWGQELRFVPGLLHEDLIFTLEAILKANKFIERPTLAYHYILREGSITTAVDIDRVRLKTASYVYIIEQTFALMNQYPGINFINFLCFQIESCFQLARQINSFGFDWQIFKLVLRMFSYDLFRRDFRSARGVMWMMRRSFEAVLFSRLDRRSLRFQPIRD